MKLRSSTLFLLSAVLGLGLACADGGGLSGAGKKKKDSKDEASDDENSEDIKTSEPQQVSGAWLACAFMDSQQELEAKAKASAEAVVDIGCGVYDSQNKHIVLQDLNWRWYLIDNKGKTRELQGRVLPPSAGLKIELPVSMRELMGTIQVTIANGAGMSSARRKSITTINYFGARYGTFDVAAYRASEISEGALLVDQIPANVPPEGVVPDGKGGWFVIAFTVVKGIADSYATTMNDQTIATAPQHVHTGGEVFVPSNPQWPSQQPVHHTSGSHTGGGSGMGSNGGSGIGGTGGSSGGSGIGGSSGGTGGASGNGGNDNNFPPPNDFKPSPSTNSGGTSGGKSGKSGKGGSSTGGSGGSSGTTAAGTSGGDAGGSSGTGGTGGTSGSGSGNGHPPPPTNITPSTGSGTGGSSGSGGSGMGSSSSGPGGSGAGTTGSTSGSGAGSSGGSGGSGGSSGSSGSGGSTGSTGGAGATGGSGGSGGKD